MLVTMLHRMRSSVHEWTDLVTVHAVVPLDTLPMVHISIDWFAKHHPQNVCSTDTQEHVEIDNANN